MSNDNEGSAAMRGSLAWIPVADQLPNENCKVLTFGLQKYPVVCSFWRDDKSFRDGGKVDGVTHWMELPAPPTTSK